MGPAARLETMERRARGGNVVAARYLMRLLHRDVAPRSGGILAEQGRQHHEQLYEAWLSGKTVSAAARLTETSTSTAANAVRRCQRVIREVLKGGHRRRDADERVRRWFKDEPLEDPKARRPAALFCSQCGQRLPKTETA